MQVATTWQYLSGVIMCGHMLCGSGEAFPTLEVHNMACTSPGTFLDCPDVLAVASQHLRSEFGDAQKVMGTPSLLKRFVKLPHTQVLALMDRYENTSYWQPSRVTLFDKWCSARAGQNAIQQLCSQTDEFPLKEVYSLLPQIHVRASFLPVMQAAKALLYQRYGDVSAIITSSHLLESFSSLPQPAVLALLRSDDLVIDSEVTALLLLDVWLQAGEYTANELIQLQSVIR